MKNPLAAAVLNIIPGFGYFYVGGYRRVLGSFLLVSGVVSLALPSESLTYPIEVIWPVIASSILLQIGIMVDAYLAAKAVNKNR